MAQSFTCPNCSAPLDYEGTDLTVRCPYCSSSVIVPEMLRGQSPTAPPHAPSLPVQGMDSTLAQAFKLKEMIQLIRSGNKIEAIQLYGQTMGVGLTEAMTAVDKLAAGQPVVLQRSSVVTSSTTPAFQPISTTYTPTYSSPAASMQTTVTTSGRAAAGGLACSGVFAGLIMLIVVGIAAATFFFMRSGNSLNIPGLNIPGLTSFAERTLAFGQGEGDGPGFFKDARVIAVDGAGYIYTGEYDTRRIQVFDSQGNFVNQWELQSEQPYLSGLAATRDGLLYVAVSGYIQRYNGQTGELVDTLYRREDHDNEDVSDLVITSNGELVAVTDETIFWFNSDGQLARETEKPLYEILYGSEGNIASIGSVNSLAVDGSGNLYLAIFPDYQIYKLSPEGQVIDRIGGEGEGNGKFRSWPDAVAVDGQGRLYAYDFQGIQVFDPNGAHLGWISIEGNTFDMVINVEQELFVMDRNANKVFKFKLPPGEPIDMDNIQPGQQIGSYRVVNQIGQGGMATVYKAYQAAMDRYVALKVLPSEFARSAEFMSRFQQEARTIAKLEHAHILPVYDYGENDGITYFVMRLLETGTLKERITAQRLSLPEIDEVFTQVADALGYAHQHGVVHRDIKPSSILIDKHGDAFLTDFGIAKILEEGAPQHTSTGAITGTPAYMNPEQAQGEKLDQRSDIYALGIVLYEMVVGRVPFEAETPLAIILKHLQAPLPPPSLLKPDLHPDLERVLLKALAKDRNERFLNCKEFLEAWKAAMKVSASAPPTSRMPVVTPTQDPTYPVTPISQPNSSSNTLWIVGGLGLAALCLCGFLTLGAGASLPFIGSLNIFGSDATTAPTPRNVESTAPAQATAVVQATLPPPTEFVASTLAPLATEAPQSIGFLTPVVSFGGEGTGPGFFTDPRHIAADGAGNIYVGDYGENGRVQVFDPTGKFVTQWRTGSDAILVAMTVDRDGTVYILQGWEILRYEGATGNLIGRVARNPDFETLTFTVENELVVVTDDAITRYNANLEPEMTTPKSLPDMLGESILSVNNVAVDGEGNIYLTDTFLYNVFKFSSDGRLLDRFGSEGDNPASSQLRRKPWLWMGRDEFYTSEFNGITVFDKNGAFLTSFDVDGLVFDMAVTLQNELLIIDRNAYKVTKYQINP